MPGIEACTCNGRAARHHYKTGLSVRLFVYGTLLHPRRLAAHSGEPGLRPAPATLRGWRRVRFSGTPFPTLRRDPYASVSGAVIEAGAAALHRIAAYEGSQYRLVRVRVRTGNGVVAAFTW